MGRFLRRESVSYRRYRKKNDLHATAGTSTYVPPEMFGFPSDELTGESKQKEKTAQIYITLWCEMTPLRSSCLTL